MLFAKWDIGGRADSCNDGAGMMGGGIDCPVEEAPDISLARLGLSVKPFVGVPAAAGGEADEAGAKDIVCVPGFPSSFFLVRPSQFSRIL